MIEIKKDRKSDTWIITTEDGQGFHRQINVTRDDMEQLIKQWEFAKNSDCRDS